MERSKDHALIDLLVLALCARLCGAEGLVDFAEFGQARGEFLHRFLERPKGIPSHDAFRRVLARLDPVPFAECFRHWTGSLRQTISAELVACATPQRKHRRQDLGTKP